jgi:putative transposase
MTTFIDDHKQEYGVEPMCKVLPIAPSTYYASKSRPLSERALSDPELEKEIKRIYDDNYGVYGVRKIWKQLAREGKPVARCTIARLMRKLGLQGVIRGKTWKTTKPDSSSPRPADLVDRQFHVIAPNRLWVADLTYVRTWAGMTYAAFVMDAFSRRILGWQTATTLRTDLALDALDMALWTRRKEDVTSVVHHSDRGVQYLSIRYTERLAEAGAVTSVGSRGDSYDNALAESIIGLYKTELIRKRGPWKNLDDVEFATLEWVDWFNHRRLFGPIGDIPPAELEEMFYRGEVSAEEAGLKQTSLY